MTAAIHASDLVRAVLRATNTHEAEAPIAQALAQARAEGRAEGLEAAALEYQLNGGYFTYYGNEIAARLRALAAGVAGQPSGDAK